MSAHPYQMGSKLLPDERGSAPLPNAYNISTRISRTEARDVGVTGNADVTADVGVTADTDVNDDVDDGDDDNDDDINDGVTRDVSYQ